MLQIEVAQAQESLPQLIEAASHGEEVIITQSAAPVAKLIAAQSNGFPETTTFSNGIHQEEEFAAGLPPSPLMQNGRLQYGSVKGEFIMREDFDAPIEGFAEYQ